MTDENTYIRKASQKPSDFVPMYLLKRCIANRFAVCYYVIINANGSYEECYLKNTNLQSFFSFRQKLLIF